MGSSLLSSLFSFCCLMKGAEGICWRECFILQLPALHCDNADCFGKWAVLLLWHTSITIRIRKLTTFLLKGSKRWNIWNKMRQLWILILSNVANLNWFWKLSNYRSGCEKLQRMWNSKWFMWTINVCLERRGNFAPIPSFTQTSITHICVKC